MAAATTTRRRQRSVVLTIDDEATQPPQAGCATRIEAPSCDQLYERAREWVSKMGRQRRQANEASLSPADRLARLLRRWRPTALRRRAGAVQGRPSRLEQQIQDLLNEYPDLVPFYRAFLETLANEPIAQEQEAANPPEGEVRQMQQQLAQLQTTLREAQAGEQALRDALDASLRENNALREALQNVSAQSAALMEAVRTQGAAREQELIAALDSYAAQMADLTLALQESEAEVQRLDDALRTEAERVTALQDETERMQTQIDTLTGQYEARNQEYEQLSAFVSQLEQGVQDRLLPLLQRTGEENQALASENARLVGESGNLRRIVGEQRAVNASLVNDLAEADRIAQARAQEVRYLNDAVNSLLASRETSIAPLAEAIREAPLSQREITQLGEILAPERRIQELRDINRTLRQQLNASERRRAILEERGTAV